MAQIAAEGILKGFTSTLLTFAFKFLFLAHKKKKEKRIIQDCYFETQDTRC